MTFLTRTRRDSLRAAPQNRAVGAFLNPRYRVLNRLSSPPKASQQNVLAMSLNSGCSMNLPPRMRIMQRGTRSAARSCDAATVCLDQRGGVQAFTTPTARPATSDPRQHAARSHRRPSMQRTTQLPDRQRGLTGQPPRPRPSTEYGRTEKERMPVHSGTSPNC